MAIKSDFHFAIDDSAPVGSATGSGSVQDPFRGPSGDATWFDSILSANSSSPHHIPPNSTLRLGPGAFSTTGCNHSADKWSVRSGWRILGAGVHATTLKLAGVRAQEHRAAIGMNY